MTSRLVIGLGAAIIAAVVGAAVLWRMAPQPTADTTAAGAGPGAAIVVVTPPAELSPEARIGKTAFDAKCAECHGPDAAGREGTAPPLIHKYYEPNHHSDEAFMRAARFGVKAHHWPFGDMAPVEGLTDADLRAITRYVREVQKANGIF